jgi:hypothetical protein
MRNNQTNQDCVGRNLCVCPTIANSVGISKQTEFSFANASTSCKLASKERKQSIGRGEHTCASSYKFEIILRFSAGDYFLFPQKYAEKDK